MGHSTWLGRTHMMGRKRSAAPAPTAALELGVTGRRGRGRRVALGCALGYLLVGMLLGGIPATALAATPEMPGEWELHETFAGNETRGIALIDTEANAQGEFTSNSLVFDGFLPGVFSGTLEGSTATVKVTTQAAGQFPASEFTSNTMAVGTTGGGLPSISGSGTFMSGGVTAPGALTAVRLRTEKQIEEQEAQEKREQEERTARANIRGEWELVISSAGGTLKGTATIAEEANSKNEFISSSALFEGVTGGTFSGTLKGSEASVTVNIEGFGSFPPAEFSGTGIKVQSASNPSSMSGAGTITAGSTTLPATIVATRTKTHRQLQEEREAREKQEQEANEKLAREAAEKTASEKLAREANEKLAREAAEKAAGKTPPPPPPLVSALIATRTVTVNGAQMIPLELTNPNASTVTVRLKLTLAKTGKTSSTKHSSAKSNTLGEGSFSIAGKGSEIVKLKLSKSGHSELASRKTLNVVVTLNTTAAGQPSISKTFALTLRAAKAHGKH
ncbi:MAG TPA: hypothetical protein VIJ50_11490 [Solirubrobacteraceae bacterium]